MTDPLTLPGDIPGLLRRGSPVVVLTRTYNRRGVCLSPGEAGWVVTKGEGMPKDCQSADCALDLSAPTGLVHAVWWLGVQRIEAVRAAARVVDGIVYHFDERVRRAQRGTPMDNDAAVIRRVVLHVAGREVAP